MRRLKIGEKKRKKEGKKKPQDENIMACPIPWGGHNQHSAFKSCSHVYVAP